MFEEILRKCERIFEPNAEYDAEFIFTDDYKIQIITQTGTVIIDLFEGKIELNER